jgi:hypothetical protein
MRTSRLILITAAACTGIAAAYLPPSGTDPWEQWRRMRSAERDFARRMGTNLYNARLALTTLQFRDSTLENAAPYLRGVDVFVDPEVPEGLALHAKALIRDSIGGLAASPEVPFTIGFLHDTNRTRDGFQTFPPQRIPVTFHHLPDTNRPSCLTVTTIGGDIKKGIVERREGEPIRSPYRLPELIGPCVLYARFGLPSHNMRNWLANGGVNHNSTLMARCSKGERIACGNVLTKDFSGELSPYGPDIFSIRGGESRGEVPRFNRSDLAFFDRMEKEFGPDAVQAIWIDPNPLTIAFQSATGADLADWFSGTIQPNAGDEFQPQVVLSPWQTLKVFGFSTLAFLVALGLNMRGRIRPPTLITS